MTALTLKCKDLGVSVYSSTTGQEGRSNCSHTGVLPSIRDLSWVESELKRSACAHHSSGATKLNGRVTGQAAQSSDITGEGDGLSNNSGATNI